MQNEPTDPQAELREQIEDMAMKYNIPLADLESLIDELLTTERERVIGEINTKWLEIGEKNQSTDSCWYEFSKYIENKALKKGTE